MYLYKGSADTDHASEKGRETLISVVNLPTCTEDDDESDSKGPCLLNQSIPKRAKLGSTTNGKLLTDLPEELLHQIVDYIADDVVMLCALDVTCKVCCSTTTKPFWERIALEKYGTKKGAKQSYLSGKSLTTRAPIQFRLEHPIILQGSNRYASCLAASDSFIVTGTYPHPQHTESSLCQKNMLNYPLQVLKADTMEPVNWVSTILHGPCYRVALIGNTESTICAVQTSDNEIWACHGCVKAKVLLPEEESQIRGMAGSKHGLAVVQGSILCWYVSRPGALLALHQTIELNESETECECALTFSLKHEWLCYVGSTHVKVYHCNNSPSTKSDVIDEVVTFPHNILNYSGGTVAISNDYIVLTRSQHDDSFVRVYSMPRGESLEQIDILKKTFHCTGLLNSKLKLHIVTHFLVCTFVRGVGLYIFDLRTGKLIRELDSNQETELHDMVWLPSISSLSFMGTSYGGNQMVWRFEGCQTLIGKMSIN